MPSYLVHCKISIELFGQSYYKLHRAIDAPYFFVGPWHRRFLHDNASLIALSQKLYPGDELAVVAAKFHVELDWMCTADPVLKRDLEVWAKTQVKKRAKSSRKKTGKIKKRSKNNRVKSKDLVFVEFERFKKDIRKLTEIERMAKLLRER